jgi:hypothetical protein
MTIRDVEPPLRKRYIMTKYGSDIERITRKVFNTWVRETLPLMMEIVKNEELGFLEAKTLLDTIMLETIRGMIEQHRSAENKATETYYTERWGDEDGGSSDS